MTNLKIAILLIGLCCCKTIFAQVLVQTHWDQGTPYNNRCPKVDENTSKAGCGAVAVAQILYCYQQPTHGFGYVNYKSSQIADSIQIQMDTMAFDWENTRTTYPQTYSQKEADAVATIIYACGAAMQMDYSPTASAINNYALMIYGLQHHLHLSPTSRYVHRKFYSSEEWYALINDQLTHGAPVFYRGDWRFNKTWSGHMFVIDSVSNDLYHTNYGHNGINFQYGFYDKYVDLNVMNYSGTYPGNRGVCYNARQAMIIDAFPTPDETEYPLQRCVSEEEIVCNYNKNIRSLKLAKGDTLVLSCRLRNVCNQTATIQFGWGLVQNNQLQRMLSNHHYVLGAGRTFTKTHHQPLAIPANIENGNYQLVLYSKSDIDTTWNEVWIDAPNAVEMIVQKENITIQMPDNHSLDPELSLQDEITEVETWRPDLVAGRTFRINFVNETTNNFEDTIKMILSTSNHTYEYKDILTVYSQSNVRYEWLVPKSIVDLQSEQIQSIRLFYWYKDNYHEVQIKHPTSTWDVNLSPTTNFYFDILGRRVNPSSPHAINQGVVIY